jgi:hypothetical protein
MMHSPIVVGQEPSRCTRWTCCSILAARFLRPSFAEATVTQSHSQKSGAPGGAGSWATPRGRMLPPARASGVARATEDPLARTACFGRAAPPGAPPPSRFSAAAVDRRCPSSAPARRRPASSIGVLTASGKIRFLTRNIDLLSSIDSYHIETPRPLNLRPRRLSDQ